MKISLRGVFLPLVWSFALAAGAQTPVGRWTGRMDFSGVKARDAREQSQLAMMKKAFGKAATSLVLKPDRSYVVVLPNPGRSGGARKTGTWSQKGRAVTLSGKSGRSQVLTMSPNGRRMVMVSPPDQGPAGLKVVFTRG